MAKRGIGDNEAFWLWDGTNEYEGYLVSHGPHQLAARLRLRRRFTTAGGSPGRPVFNNLLERQQVLSGRVCFGQSPAVELGALLECWVETVQPSGDRQYDLLLSGTFKAISDEYLEALSHLSSDQAQQFLRSRQAGSLSRGNRGDRRSTSGF
jgi:hypothetical protein